LPDVTIIDFLDETVCHGTPLLCTRWSLAIRLADISETVGHSPTLGRIVNNRVEGV